MIKIGTADLHLKLRVCGDGNPAFIVDTDEGDGLTIMRYKKDIPPEAYSEWISQLEELIKILKIKENKGIKNMISDSYTENYTEWVVALENKTKNVTFVYPKNCDLVGKYCIDPHFRYNNICFTVSTITGIEEDLNDCINKFAVLYCIYKVDDSTKKLYNIRGVLKEKFEEMMKPKTYTVDLHNQCYDKKSLEECAKAIENFIERNVSVYENTEDVYPPPSYKIKVTLELK